MSFLEDSITSDWASSSVADSVYESQKHDKERDDDSKAAEGPGGDAELLGSPFRPEASQTTSIGSSTKEAEEASTSLVGNGSTLESTGQAESVVKPAGSSEAVSSAELVPGAAVDSQENADSDGSVDQAEESEKEEGGQAEEEEASEGEEEPQSEADRERNIIAGWWSAEESLSLDERRRRYRCGQNFVELDDVLSWPVYSEAENLPPADEAGEGARPLPAADDELAGKISHWTGDITKLEIDAVVNAANEACLGGGGIDGAIHRAAGRSLFNECSLLHGCPTGQTKITRGYNLPARFVLHTVGPIGRVDDKLHSCYRSCLDLVAEHGIRTVAFCGISTGIFGFPLYPASRIALETARNWLEEGDNRSKVDRIIFCTFLAKEKACYDELIPEYFPTSRDERLRREAREAEEQRLAAAAAEAEAVAAAEAEKRAAEEAVARQKEEAEAARLQAQVAAAAAVAKERAEEEARSKAKAEAAQRAEEEQSAAAEKASQSQLSPSWYVLAGLAAATVIGVVAIRRRS